MASNSTVAHAAQAKYVVRVVTPSVKDATSATVTYEAADYDPKTRMMVMPNGRQIKLDKADDVSIRPINDKHSRRSPNHMNSRRDQRLIKHLNKLAQNAKPLTSKTYVAQYDADQARIKLKVTYKDKVTRMYTVEHYLTKKRVIINSGQAYQIPKSAKVTIIPIRHAGHFKFDKHFDYHAHRVNRVTPATRKANKSNAVLVLISAVCAVLLAALIAFSADQAAKSRTSKTLAKAKNAARDTSDTNNASGSGSTNKN